jgi:hypothetical protein
MAGVRRLAFLLLATFAGAEDEEDLARTVESLVRDLGAPEADVRTLARFRLASYGERIWPLLKQVVSDEPEVRRSIRYLTRSQGKESLELLPRKDEPLPIGAPLILDVRFVNNTEQMIQLLPDDARQGEVSPFRLRFDGKAALVPVRFDQIDWGDAAVVLPGAARRFRLTIDGGSALRRPGLHEVSVVFEGRPARGYGTLDQDAVEPYALRLETPPVEIHVLGRKADDLELALKSESSREREAAARELSMRDDDAVVPILRRHARERPLRLAAIRRLGAVGAEEDYDLILEATRDESADVRRAAVLGLAKYATPKARARLLRLASDQELQTEVIRALKGHKHVATVECFVGLLSSGSCSTSNIRQIRATIRDWTGMTVDERPSEIQAFRGWWEMNRAAWAAAYASDK